MRVTFALDFCYCCGIQVFRHDMPPLDGLQGGQQIMKPRDLLIRLTGFTGQRIGWTSVRTTMLLVMMVLASLTGLTGAIPGRLLLIPGIASSLAHAHSDPAHTTNPKQEQEQEQNQQPGPGQLTQPAM